MSLRFDARHDCLHQNPEALAALGVVSPRVVPVVDCTDCALIDFEIVAKQSPSRPELTWYLEEMMHTASAEWVLAMCRPSDNYSVVGSGPTLAGAVRAATRHLETVAYAIPVGAPKTWHDRHFDAVCNSCREYGCDGDQAE